MATYAIGDIQGCYSEFKTLLEQVQFCPTKDTLWVAGDMVNRGPNNVDVLRYIKSLGSQAKVVLGNHDLHLLAVFAGAKKSSKKDTISDVLKAPDCNELLQWLRTCPLIHTHENWVLSHAGVPHIWTTEQACSYAKEVSNILKGEHCNTFLHNMYGNTPSDWSPGLESWPRLRVITNYLTRMRFIGPQGHLNLKAKEGLDTTPSGMAPWFKYPRPACDTNKRYAFGHWAALEGKTHSNQFQALDTGCVWGGSLSMLRLEDDTRHSTPCAIS